MDPQFPFSRPQHVWDCGTPACKKITFTELFFNVKFYSFAIGNKCKSVLHACEIVTAVILPLHHLMALLSCFSDEGFSEFNKRENIVFPGQLDSVLISDSQVNARHSQSPFSPRADMPKAECLCCLLFLFIR